MIPSLKTALRSSRVEAVRYWVAVGACGSRPSPQTRGRHRSFSGGAGGEGLGEKDPPTKRAPVAKNEFAWRVNHMVSLPSSLGRGIGGEEEGEEEGAWSSSKQESRERFASQGGGGLPTDSLDSMSSTRVVMPNFITPRPAKIILIRHGESEGNRDESVYTTKADWKIGLTQLGKNQARQAGRRLRDIVGAGDVHIYHSPYMRAVETTSEILKSLDPSQVKVVREEPRISEQQFGNLRDVDAIRRCKEERKVFGRFFFRFPDGEAGLDVYSRVTTFIGTLRRDQRDENCTVVIVTHGLALRLFLMRWFQWTVEQFEATRNPTFGGIAIMNRIPADGRYRLTPSTLDMIGAENAPTTSAIGRTLLRKAYTRELLSNHGGV